MNLMLVLNVLFTPLKVITEALEETTHGLQELLELQHDSGMKILFKTANLGVLEPNETTRTSVGS